MLKETRPSPCYSQAQLPPSRPLPGTAGMPWGQLFPPSPAKKIGGTMVASWLLCSPLSGGHMVPVPGQTLPCSSPTAALLSLCASRAQSRGFLDSLGLRQPCLPVRVTVSIFFPLQHSPRGTPVDLPCGPFSSFPSTGLPCTGPGLSSGCESSLFPALPHPSSTTVTQLSYVPMKNPHGRQHLLQEAHLAPRPT